MIQRYLVSSLIDLDANLRPLSFSVCLIFVVAPLRANRRRQSAHSMRLSFEVGSEARNRRTEWSTQDSGTEWRRGEFPSWPTCRIPRCVFTTNKHSWNGFLSPMYSLPSISCRKTPKFCVQILRFDFVARGPNNTIGLMGGWACRCENRSQMRSTPPDGRLSEAVFQPPRIRIVLTACNLLHWCQTPSQL